MSDFLVPADLINSNIEIFMKIPIAGQGGTIAFPSFKSTLVGDAPGLLILRTEDGKNRFFPKDNVQHIDQVSAVKSPTDKERKLILSS